MSKHKDFTNEEWETLMELQAEAFKSKFGDQDEQETDEDA